MAVRLQLQLGMGRRLLQPADFQALPSSGDAIAWQKKAGKMLLPRDFSLVGAFCRVPVQKENSGIEAAEERVKPAPSRSEGGVERTLTPWASSDTSAIMSQQGDDRGSNSSSVRGKKQRGAVPPVWEQQPAGCQRSSSAWQRTEGRDGDGPSSLPRKRAEPARPWNGAGQGGKRKASSESDAGGLPVKRSLAERQRGATDHDVAPKRERGAEPSAKIYVKAVQEVLSERARLQAGGLPTAAGPSSGRRPSPAVCPRSVSQSLAGGKRKGLEAEQQTAAQLPANKRARAQSGGSVPAPAAQPGPAAARSSKLRARRQQREKRVEQKKAALRAAAARAERSAMNSLVEMMQKLQLND
ncbi:zinc finger CCCH domain-containing protein 11A-like isoform X2 [Tympanuchus pallidicinctus]|uniref:zinc finger CCCH domain-containing protein 11A-like isoform X2 n=1 Tax=Tympanuchus pallidicinctus TaxID=109042 RepID=UPI0022871913|nr:zinc finger CCCH domain-containing protein 11A-like isoform X2 [Tympanuchus pallidicinctus]